MGKKLSQASVKITKKNDHKKQQQQQLNSLINVLRPKVYITDSSSFKSLVQELTGNGNIPLVSSPPPHPIVLLDDHVLPAPVIEIDDDVTMVGYNCYQQGSPDFSSFASSELSVPTNSLTPSLDYYCSPEELGIHHQPTTTAFNELDSSLANNINNDDNIDHLSQYRNVESWLLEMDPFLNSNYERGYVPLNILPEACMYDYELSGLII